MVLPLMGMLMLIGLATAVASIVTVVLMLRYPPVSASRLCAVLVLVSGSLAVAVYCYGWFSVLLGGPFPQSCGDGTASDAELVRIEQEAWPLRSACVYADGATVEHVSMSISVLVCLLAGLAIVLACASAVLHRRVRSSPVHLR
ncbi:hypothetical protein GCM10010358_39640 [Streptomyces minutiscleroticus]|uniref:Uncharacterized protein n=2 Tax=Streptomyces minutiscleroticus TaxID=68238 RepID=A0A918NMM9_9ACTN|nr:hypothetical protein GCM10010358_39640 [Streptomyces minutiscleroticus]